MSSLAPKSTNGKTPSNHSNDGFYVYCIGERDALAVVFDETLPGSIEPEAALESVAKGILAAVVSPVSLADYGEEALESRLADPTWTALRAMRHEKVVEHFARRTSVVPLRFGTIYLKRSGIERMLTQKRDALEAIIERLRGREEWGVNLYCDRSILTANITQVSPRLRELADRENKASPGKSYLIRKEIESLREKEVRAEIKRVAAVVAQELSEHGESAMNLRVLKDEATEHGDLVAKMAFLVDRSLFDAFRSAAEKLAGQHASGGFQLELTGPWPAYNFATDG